MPLAFSPKIEANMYSVKSTVEKIFTMKLSSSPSIILVSLFFLQFFCSANARMKIPENATIPGVIVFGDSIVDAGNNNKLATVIKCDFPPYGRDFQGGIPTGRFCNGKIPSDFVAEELGIRDTLPAYLDPALKPEDLLTGVTFASGGSGFDTMTPALASVISLSQQLEYFKEYIGRLRSLVGEERTDFILNNSLFLVVAGSDDIANTYFVLRARKEYDMPSYTNLMVNNAMNFISEIYKLGARRIGVFGAPPIGCVPSQRTISGGMQRGCAANYNEAATMFNQKLTQRVDSLAKQLHNNKIVYVDIYNPLLDLILHPQKQGFRVVTEGCCGTGKIEVAILCNPLSVHTCSNVNEYLFWDSYHPTERAYRILVKQVLGNVLARFY